MDKSVLEMYGLLPYYKHGVVKNVLIVKYPNWKRQSILEVKKTNTNMVLAIEAMLVGHDSFACICFFMW